MKTGVWRGNSRQPVAPWKLQARKAKAIASNQNYGNGGLPRRAKATAITLPKLRCQDEPA